MCTRCNLAAPRDADGFCPACAIELRAEARRGHDAIARHLDSWAAFERWLARAA